MYSKDVVCYRAVLSHHRTRSDRSTHPNPNLRRCLRRLIGDELSLQDGREYVVVVVASMTAVPGVVQY
jgi:hypothetical protein